MDPKRVKNIVLIAALIIFVTTSVLVILNFTVRRSSKIKLQQRTPEIWLATYSLPTNLFGTPAPKEFRILPTFKDPSVTKNGTEYITDIASNLGFVCEASYPVEWTVPKMSQLEYNYGFDISSGSERLSDFTSSQPVPKTKHFRAYLRIFRFTKPSLFHEPIGKFLSAAFSCRATPSAYTPVTPDIPLSKKPLNFSNIYVYMAGNETIENQGKTLSISYTSSKSNGNVTSSTVTFPCRAAQPNLQLLLEKKNKSRWEKLPSLYYSFDPKIGFTFPAGSSLWGTYRCRTNETDVFPLSVLTINVTGSNSTKSGLKVEPFHSDLTGNARVDVGDRIRCCTGNESVRPNLFLSKCNNRLQCEIAREITLPKEKMLAGGIRKDFNVEDENDCSSVNRLKQPFMVDCKGENVDFLGVVGMTFQPNAGNVSWRDSESKIANISLTKFTDIANNKYLEVKEKVLIVVGHHEKFEDAPTGKGDFLPGASHFHMNLFETWNQEDVIIEYARNFYLEGEPLRIACFGLRNVHSFGAKLRLNWKNGTKSLLEKDEVPVMRKFYFHGISADMSRDEYNFFVVYFAKEVKANLEMESVDCFMPVEGKTSWDMLRYSLNVRRTTSIKSVQ